MRKTLNEKLLDDVTNAIKNYNETEVGKNQHGNSPFNISIRSVQASSPRREKIKKETSEKLEVVARMAK